MITTRNLVAETYPVIQDWLNTVVPPVWAGIAVLAGTMAVIAVLSLVARRLDRAINRLGWLSGLVQAVATPWHELCHLAGSIMFGHRIIHVRLWPRPRKGLPAQVKTAYNRRNLYQALGNSVIGWAPALISGALIVLIGQWRDVVPGGLPGELSGELPGDLIDGHALAGQDWLDLLIYPAYLVLGLGMALSKQDWKAALQSLFVLVPAAAGVGWLVWPDGMRVGSVVMPVLDPVVLVLTVLVVTWVVAVVVGLFLGVFPGSSRGRSLQPKDDGVAPGGRVDTDWP